MKLSNYFTFERNLQEVKEKITTSTEAFHKFGEAHRNYAAELVNEEEKTKCMEYSSREEEKFTEICRQVLDWISRVEENLLAVSNQERLLARKDCIT